MTESADQEGSVRPHLVMVVGNRVKGDSRVEKAAMTAHRAGYRVTVVGLKHRSVARLDTLGEVPIYRVAPDYALYNAWRLKHDVEAIEPYVKALSADQALHRLHNRGRWDRSVGRSTLRTIEEAAHRRFSETRLRVRRSWLRMRLAISDFRARLPMRGAWRPAWPLISDLELSFGAALVDLKPDVLHVHDRDPLPAAETTKNALGRADHEMTWVYDAHEWLPGVVFTGPRVHRTAWLAAEAELVKRADAVITVSEERSRQLARRHHLATLPTVVTNSPIATHEPDHTRRTVRDECGLGSDVALMVYVGRIDERRGLETVLKALPSLPEVHLAVVAPSDPRPRETLVSLARELGVASRIHILDYVAAHSVTWYLSTATAGLSPLEHNAAHHQDVATKVREYLHAGLPVVGSDVRAQAQFISENRIGIVHRAGDSEDCALAIAQVIRDRDSYRSAITKELLIQNSWEHQEQLLLDVWAGLTDSPPLGPRVQRQSPRLTIGPVVDPDRSTRLMEAIRSSTPITGQLLGRVNYPGYPEIRQRVSHSAALNLKLEEYRALVAESDGLLLEGFGSLFGGLLGDAEEQLGQLIKTLRIAVMLDSIAIVDPHQEMERFPDSWLHSLDDTQRTQISHQVQRTHRLIHQFGLEVLATSPIPMPEVRASRWLPTVVPIRDQVHVNSGPIRLVIAPEQRGGADAAVPRIIANMAGPKMDVLLPQSNSELVVRLSDADILVDNLGHGSYTDIAAAALGSGCVVLSHLADEAAEVLPDSCPVVKVTPHDVQDVLVDLVSDREHCEQTKAAGLEYAREIHDGRQSADIVATTFGWSLTSEA